MALVMALSICALCEKLVNINVKPFNLRYNQIST